MTAPRGLSRVLLLDHEKAPPLRICWKGLTSGNELKTRTCVHGHPELAQVVGGHAAGAVAECDRSYRQAVKGDPQLGAVGQVHLLDADRQDAEAAAAAELASRWREAVPVGAWPLNAGPLSASFSFPFLWQPGGLGRAGR